MNQFKTFFSVLIAIVALTSGCKTDVDIIGPYKEQAVIYGLLDPSSSIQYIKVNRVFLGKGDANQMAQIPDSFNYKPDDIEVSILQIKGTTVYTPIILKDTIITGAAAGVFNKNENIIYYTRVPLDYDSQYKLTVKNKKTGYMAESTTKLVGSLNLSPFTPDSAPTIDFIKADKVNFVSPRMTWNTANNAKIYEFTVRFNYREYTQDAVNDTVYKKIDWVFFARTEYFEQVVNGKDFFDFIKSSITPSTNGLVRQVLKEKRIETFVTAAGEDYQIYKDLSNPTNAGYQEKPIYTNVKNGLGIFSSRATSKIRKRTIGIPTLDYLKLNSLANLGFIDPPL